MKFTMSFASVALVILALPLLWVKPGGALPGAVPRGGALFNGAWPGVSRFGVARLGFAPGYGADLGIERRDVARPSGAQSPIKTIYPTFTTITVPGAGYTGAWGINSAGEVVGNYGQNINSGEDAHGFVYKNGKFKYFDYPGATVTAPTGINDYDTIVGYTRTGYGPINGFLYRGGVFTTLIEGSDADTSTLGINNENEIVGGSGASIYGTKGFKLRNGHYETVIFPGQDVYTYLTAVNSLGVAVGWTGPPDDAYVYENGHAKNIDFPGALDSEVQGINDGDVIVGSYGVGGAYYAFAMKNGVYVSFAYPEAETFAIGVNASGQISGQYTFDYQTYYGFVTDPITVADFD